MDWTFNDKTPEQLGVTIGSWTEQPMSIDVLNLTAVVEDYTGDVPPELAKESIVTVKNGATVMFQGRVTKTPRDATGSSEQLGYKIEGGWWDLDHLPFQQERKYYDGLDAQGEPKKVTKHMSYVILGRDGEKTGQRITTVIDNAISQGANLQKGAIDEGIVWMVTEHKDRMCGQVIRDYMRLVPDQIAWIDYSTTPPTFNVSAQKDLTSIDFDIANNELITQHQIDGLEVERPKGVVIRWEKPITVDGDTQVQIIEDTAGATTGFGVLPISIPLDGLNITSEKAVSIVRDIPQDQADQDKVKKWWMLHMPELQKVANDIGEAALFAKLKLPSANVPNLDIRMHTLKLADPPEPPTPLNPNAVPVVPSIEVSDYPREQIGGGLPDWAKVRVGGIEASITMAITKTNLETMAPAAVKQAMVAIFTDQRFIEGKEYFTTTRYETVVGTNAKNKEYSHIASFESGEDPPTGIAAAVLAQYDRVRHEGSLTLKEQELTKMVRPGMSVNVLSGRPEWAAMKEVVQSVSYRIATGETTVTIGAPRQLSVEDMVERLKAFERVPATYGFDPDEDHPEPVGGLTSTPKSSPAKLTQQSPAQSHYFGFLEVFRNENGGAEMVPVPTHFHELSATEVKRHDVLINGQVTTATPRPKITLSGNAQWKVYITFKTDAKGKIDAPVTAHFTTAAVPASTHHIPPSAGGSGQTGEYRKLIGIYNVPASAADKIIFEPVASPTWECIDREFVNLGSGAKVHKETTKIKQELRSLVGSAGASGATEQGNIVVLENADDIEFKVFFKKSGGSPTSGESGVTGLFRFLDKDNVDIVPPLSFDEGWLIAGAPRDLKVQTPIEGGSYIATDRAGQKVDLINANKGAAAPNLQPKGEKMGMWPYYIQMGGECGATANWCYEPTALAVDPNGNLLQSPTDVIEVTVEIQYNTPGGQDSA